MTIHRDWSQLPSELLEHVAEHIVSISNFIRFRSVCKSWRAAALLKKLRPQPPLLLLPYNNLNADRYIFSLATKRTHRLHLPQLVGKRIVTTTDGWMLLADIQTNSLFLFNPITLAQIQLPSTDKFVKPVVTFGYIFHDRFADSFVVLVRDNASGQGTMFCKAGDESWSVLETNLDYGYHTITYHKGKFFIGELDFLYIYDPSIAYSEQAVPACSLNAIPEYSMECECDAFFYPYNGELLLVLYAEEYPERGFSFYKLDYDGPKIKTSKVQPEHYAMIYYSFMFCVKDFPQFKECCVYSNWRFGRFRGEDRDKPVVGILDWKVGTCDVMECGWERPDDFKGSSQWITPSFQ